MLIADFGSPERIGMMGGRGGGGGGMSNLISPSMVLFSCYSYEHGIGIA